MTRQRPCPFVRDCPRVVQVLMVVGARSGASVGLFGVFIRSQLHIKRVSFDTDGRR